MSGQLRGQSDSDSVLTPAQWRERLAAYPDPLAGPRPLTYEAAAGCLAKAILIVADERPLLLNVERERANDPSGLEAANNDKLWEAVKERWPAIENWLGGITGFQYGWAHNTVRYIVGAPPTGNPAIATVGE